MQVKNDAKSISSDDYFYDLFLGGYLNPEDFLADSRDIDSIRSAMKTIERYFNTLEENDLLSKC